MKLITAYESKLTTVPRWGIVRTIQEQSVADHSFLVALMAHRIATEFFGYNEEYDAASLLRINRYALLHDQHEAFTGDIPSPVRPAMDKERAERWFDGFVNEKFDTDHDIKLIVKLADYLESIAFLTTEMELGNRSVGTIRTHIIGKYRSYCMREHIGPLTSEQMLDQVLVAAAEAQDPLDVTTAYDQGELGDDCPF